MKIDGNQIKVGNILEINSKLWRVLKTQQVKPPLLEEGVEEGVEGAVAGGVAGDRGNSPTTIVPSLLDFSSITPLITRLPYINIKM